MANLARSGSRSPSPPVVGWRQIWGDKRFDLTRFLAIRPAACYRSPGGVPSTMATGATLGDHSSICSPKQKGASVCFFKDPPICTHYVKAALTVIGHVTLCASHHVTSLPHRLPIDQESNYIKLCHICPFANIGMIQQCMWQSFVGLRIEHVKTHSFVTKGLEQPKSHPDSVFGVGFNFACPHTFSAGGPGS